MAKQWLRTSRGGRVHSLYRNAVNLVDEAGELFSVVMPPLGPGPFALQLRAAPDALLSAGGFEGMLDGRVPVRMRPEVLELGPIHVHLTDLQTWVPRPNWDGLRASLTAATVEQLGQLLRQVAPPGSLAPLADGAARSLWPEGVPSEDLPAALLHRIADLVPELLSGLSRSDRDQIWQAASKLAGLGGGVTPAGDDFLLGAIHALWVTREAETAQDLSNAAVEVASLRTNVVSVAWLRAAARGEAAHEWHALFEAVTQDLPIDRAARRLIQRGHTSGADGLAGFLAGLQVLAPALQPARS
ncbi:MAG: DUF2877 domain-containing protein [Anaerolineales bacterium]